MSANCGFLDAVRGGLARHERINPRTGNFEFRVEVYQLEPGRFHLYVAFPQLFVHGDMCGHELLRRLRAMEVPLHKGWEIFVWQN